MTDAKIVSRSLLGDYDGYEAGLRPIQLNHHERASESLPSMELCRDIETAVTIEDSSEEYILDEVRRLIQNRTAKNAFYSGALFGLMTVLGCVWSFLIYMKSQRVFFRASTGVLWALCLTLTMMTILFAARILILNIIFRASYESRSIGKESIKQSVLSFLHYKFVTGVVVGIWLTYPWVLFHLSGRLFWIVLVIQTYPIGLLVHNSITDNRIMNGDADWTAQ